MRDGVRLAFDVYRPGVDGRSLAGASRRSCVTLPTTRRRSGTSRSPTSSSRGLRVVLVDMRDRYRSEGVGHLLPLGHAAHRPRRLRHRRVDRGPAVVERARRHGRQLVRGPGAGPHRARATAAPDGDLARRRDDEQLRELRARGRRHAGAHVLGALHPRPGRAGDRGRPGASSRTCGTTCGISGSSTARRPGSAGRPRSGTCPRSSRPLIDYYDARRLRRVVGSRIECDYTAHFDRHADVPMTVSSGWFDPWAGPDADYWAAMAAQNTAPQRLVLGPWSHVGHARGRHVLPRGRLRARQRRGAWSATSRSSSSTSHAGCRTTRRGTRPARRRSGIFVMGGGSGRKTAEGKLDHGGRWREEWEWPLARRVETTYFLHGDGSLSTARRPRPPRRCATPSTRRTRCRRSAGLYCAIGELPDEGAGMEQAWARFLHPVLRLRDLLVPGPADQREAPAFFGSEPPYPRLSERPDVLVFQTEPLTEPVEVTGPSRCTCGSPRARSTPTSRPS